MVAVQVSQVFNQGTAPPFTRLYNVHLFYFWRGPHHSAPGYAPSPHSSTRLGAVTRPPRPLILSASPARASPPCPARTPSTPLPTCAAWQFAETPPRFPATLPPTPRARRARDRPRPLHCAYRTFCPSPLALGSLSGRHGVTPITFGMHTSLTFGGIPNVIDLSPLHRVPAPYSRN